MYNIYIHIPFCTNKCAYCNFLKTNRYDDQIQAQYLLMVKQEIINSSYLLANSQIKTIYFGGGTPSLLNTDLLVDFLQFLKQRFSFNNKIEITLEANPKTINPKNLSAWQNMGINRISLGIQTCQDKFSTFLNRDLSLNLASIIATQNAGFNVNCDFIFGFPEQTVADLKADLDIIASINCHHISYYALDYKINSAIADDIDKALSLDVINDYYHIICQNLALLNYDQYEIYNFAKPQAYCWHNYDFWQQKDYLGFGLGAVSYIAPEVIENTQDIEQYLLGQFVADKYPLDINEQIELYLNRALHLTSGLNLLNLAKKFTIKPINDFISIAKKYPQWFLVNGNIISLTNLGKMNLVEAREILQQNCHIMV